MRRFWIYARLQLRRAALLAPRMLAVTLLLAVLAATAALLLRAGEDEAPEPVRIGVTGDVREETVAMALELLQSVDSSRFSVRFVPMDEREAARALRLGQIGGYAVVPEGFAYGMMTGEHRPITYVSASGGADLGAQVTRELVETIAALVLETENAVYGAQDFAAEALPGTDPYAAGDALVVRYALRVMDRARLFELETVSVTKELSLAAYYLCGLSLVFLMLWPIGCAPLFAGRNRELGLLLQAEGLGAAGQVLAEFFSYLLLMLLGLLVAGLAAALLLGRFGLSVPELEGAPGFLPGALPAALMLAALQFLLFELAEGVIAGVLLQFLNAVAQGYLAGCFYPAGFFPEGLRRFGAALPAGAGFQVLRARLLHERASPAVWLWLLLFLALAVLLRCRRNREGRA